jgi:hypothetical protein
MQQPTKEEEPVAHFRVRRTDGTETVVQAQRVSQQGSRLVFHERVPEAWRTVCELPSEDVEDIHRRITEHNGNMRWISEPYAEAASAESR